MSNHLFFRTRPMLEDRQMVQYSGDSITLSGFTRASHQGMIITAPSVLDYTGTTTAQTTTTINGLTGYLNGGRVSGFKVYPPVLKMSGTTGTTTVDVTGMVLTALDPTGTVVWAAGGGSGGTDTYLSSASLNCSNNILTLTMSDASFHTVDFTCIVTGGTHPTFTGNTSATCITDLWVSKIHSCSPLYINPLDEGNVYFGANSGFTVDLGSGSTNGNIYVKGRHILHSDTDSITDWTTLSNVFRGTLTSFDDDLTVGNVIANSNPSGNTGVFFGDFSAWPATNPTGNLSYYGTSYIRSGTPPVGNDFYRNKIVLQGNGDVDGMVIKAKTGDPEAKLWWEVDGGSVMILRGTTAAYGQTGYLGLGLNNDGTELPSVHLQVGGTAYTGTFKFVDGNQQAGYVMTSDSEGNVSWAPVSGTTSGGTGTSYWEPGDGGTDSLKTIYGNHYDTSDYSIIGSGRNHRISGSSQTDNAILGGNSNIIDGFAGFSFSNGMLGGDNNSMVVRTRYSTMLGGTNNTIRGAWTSILGGTNNYHSDNYGAIIGGQSNIVDSGSASSVIVGGVNHRVNGPDNVVILGGDGITANTANTVYVPRLNIRDVQTGTSVNNLGIDVNGNVVVGSAGGGGGTTGTTCCVDAYNDLGNVVTTMTWDMSGTSTNYEATMTGNTTLDIINVRNGDYGTMILHQDGVGSRTLTLGTVNGGQGTHRVVNGGFGTIILTSNAHAIDIISFTYNGSVLYWTVGNDYT